jgi:hypothetical protein
MSKIIDEFLEKANNSRLVKYAGVLAGLSGLFLAIPTPTIADAKMALANIQLFWLTLLTLVLTSLFINFVKFTWRKEKSILSLYDIPAGAFSVFAGVVLAGVILNLWRYMINIYPDIFAEFTVGVGLPAFVVLGAILLAIFMTKRESKIPLILSFIFDSIVVGALFGTAGFYIQGEITKLFYLYWFSIVFPAVSLIFFVLLSVVGFHRKSKFFKPYIESIQ